MVNAEKPATTGETRRPVEWARPITLRGAPNLHQIDRWLYRSAQPRRSGIQALAAGYALRTVVSLRAFHSDAEIARDLDLTLVRVPIHTWKIKDADVISALRAIRAGQRRGAVLLHCQHGADRTGLISALYRVMYHGWTKAQALAEMREGGFGYHAMWGNIPIYLERADIAALQAAIDAP